MVHSPSRLVPLPLALQLFIFRAQVFRIVFLMRTLSHSLSPLVVTNVFLAIIIHLDTILCGSGKPSTGLWLLFLSLIFLRTFSPFPLLQLLWQEFLASHHQISHMVLSDPFGHRYQLLLVFRVVEFLCSNISPPFSLAFSSLLVPPEGHELPDFSHLLI